MNILILTSVYRDINFGIEDKSTDIVNSFVYSWCEQGHRVMVIHNVHRYPRFVHEIPASIKMKMAKKIGFQFGDYKSVQKNHYEDKGADVWKLPIFKILPHYAPSHLSIKKQVSRIKNIISTNDFVPDVMIGHWASPQLEIMYELLADISCKSAIILHGTGYIREGYYSAKKYLSRIDKIGCRSKTQSDIVQKMLNLSQTPFICYSGIPDAYLRQFDFNGDKFKNINKWRFVYAGRLVSYKKVDEILKALSMLNGIDWQFDIVGEGAAEQDLRRLANELGLTDRVVFHGRVSRNEVVKIMSEAHCFVMVSKGEIFGLVYLEAMAASCITVGSRNEGIDGVLVDKCNGYLCEPGNTKELCCILENICSASSDVNISIARSGYDTAQKYSDSTIAKKYLNDVLL